MVKGSKPSAPSRARDGDVKLYRSTEGTRTLMQQKEDGITKKNRRRLERQPTDVVVDKCIRDNFKDWGNRVDTVFVGDMNVRLELRRDIRLKRMGQLKMGKLHFAKLKKKYGAHNAVMASFYAEDESAPIDVAVRDALNSWKFAKKPNSKPLFALLKQQEDPSQRTVVAVLKAAVEVDPTASVRQVGVVLEIIRWFERTGASKKFKGMMDKCRDYFDRILARHYEYQHNEGISLDEWWELNSDVASLVLDAKQFEECLKCSSSWSSVEESLKKLVLTTHLGRSAFEECYMDLALSKNIDFVQKCIDELQEGDMTLQRVREAKAAFVKKAKECGKCPATTFATTAVSVMYRGVELSVSTTSLIEQWEVKLYAMITGDAVEGKVAPALFVEDSLVPADRPMRARAIDAALVKEARVSRLKAMHLLATDAEPTASEIIKLMKSKSALLTSINQFFKVDIAFFEHMAGAVGEKAVRSAILALLPTSEICKDAGAALANITELEKRKVVGFVGSTIQAEVEVLRGWLANIRDSRTPSFGDSNSSFLLQCKARLAFFCRFESGKKRLTGASAAAAIFADLKKRPSAERTLTDLGLIMKFKWLLSADEAKAVDDMAMAVWNQVGAQADLDRKGKRAKVTEKTSVVDAYFDCAPKVETRVASSSSDGTK